MAAIALASFGSMAAIAPAHADFDDALSAYAQQKYEDAVDLWVRYAVAGDVKSKNVLGDIYSGKEIEENVQVELPSKTGVIPQDDVEALAWYILGAHHEFASYNQKPSFREINAKIKSQERMPVLKARMTDSEVREAEKRVVEILSAESEFDLYRLGMMYQSGSGLPKDNVEALKYFTLAKGRNSYSNSHASEAAKFLMAEMSEKDIEKAMKEADEWIPPMPSTLKGKSPSQLENEALREQLRQLQLARALSNIEPEFQNNDHLIQSALAALGLRPGKIDGKLGPETRSAIKRFQYTLVENDSTMTEKEKQDTITGTLTVMQTLELVKRAAEKDHPRSQYVYGIMYAEGIGVSPNGEKAISWLKKSASYGSALAHNALGIYYRDGILGEDSVEPNRSEASYHFGQAVALGYEPARQELLKLNYEFVPAAND